MPYDEDNASPALLAFERWANGFYHGSIPWPEWMPDGRRERRLTLDDIAESDAAWARVAGGWKPVSRRLAVAS